MWQKMTRLRSLSCLAFLALSASGCANTWDELTSREFSFKEFVSPPPPLVVLRDNRDGDKRAKALRSLKEPKLNGGSDTEQDAIVEILVKAASQEKQPLCRMAAIQTLAKYKDPRAVKGLTDAFYAASAFPPETTTVIRCEALAALGETKNPAALDLLVRVAKEPPSEGAELEKQQTLDIRAAAIRSLGGYQQAQATEALVQVLRTEKDVALRGRAVVSLQEITGKDLPADVKQWEDALYLKPQEAVAANPVKAAIGTILPVKNTQSR